VQPADIAVTLRRRTPYEACDLGLSMLQRWRRQIYGAHFALGGSIAALALAWAWIANTAWIAILVIWWLKPLYDRVVLHVLSRAVFGELQGPRAVLAHAKEWLGTGLLFALTLGRFDLARSFNLPVRQLEGQSGRSGRARAAVLGKRARSYAVWLMVVCLHLEFVLYWSLQSLVDMFVPAKAQEGQWAWETIFGGASGAPSWGLGDALAYATAVLLFEPFYVAAGFGLYLNRRTLLEGWDIEVALRRIAEKHAAAPMVLAFFCGLLFLGSAPTAWAAEPKNPKQEIAEVLKAPEFGHFRETLQWQRRDRPAPDLDFTWPAIGFGVAKALEAAAWIAAVALLGWLLWWMWRRLPGTISAPREPYRPPAALFGLELAPETLPADIAAAAAALAREGKLREALSLLYRGALSELVHKRGVELLASHTEGEALRVAQRGLDEGAKSYLATLVGAWAACAYARRMPEAAEVERLALQYRGALS
jgi:hypothetical protein